MNNNSKPAWKKWNTFFIWFHALFAIWWAFQSWSNYNDGNHEAGFAYLMLVIAWISLAVGYHTQGTLRKTNTILSNLNGLLIAQRDNARSQLSRKGDFR